MRKRVILKDKLKKEDKKGSRAMDSKESNIFATEASKTQPKMPHMASALSEKTEDSLGMVYDVPVKVSAILGHSKMKVKELVDLKAGTVIELDRKVGEAIDVYVNDRLVARGEVVMVEDHLGVTMTELFKVE